jgi:hypothetical protein
MGIKSKGNYNIAFCLKFDCINRKGNSKECYQCIKYNKYTLGEQGEKKNA